MVDALIEKEKEVLRQELDLPIINTTHGLSCIMMKLSSQVSTLVMSKLCSKKLTLKGNLCSGNIQFVNNNLVSDRKVSIDDHFDSTPVKCQKEALSLEHIKDMMDTTESNEYVVTNTDFISFDKPFVTKTANRREIIFTDGMLLDPYPIVVTNPTNKGDVFISYCENGDTNSYLTIGSWIYSKKKNRPFLDRSKHFIVIDYSKSKAPKIKDHFFESIYNNMIEVVVSYAKDSKYTVKKMDCFKSKNCCGIQ